MKMLQNTQATATYIADVIKANFSGWYLLLALLLFSVLFSGCTAGEQPAPEEALISNECATEVIAESILCGKGAFNNVWLVKSDGTHLQPWINESDMDTLNPGQKYYISFTAVPKDNRFSDVVTCMAVTPAADAVKITCIRVLDTN